MSQNSVSRREFLQASAVVGVTALAVGQVTRVLGAAAAAPAPTQGKMAIFVCEVCGHVEYGSAPAACPICHAPKEKFRQDDGLFTDAEAKTKDGTVKHTPVITVLAQSTLVPEQPCRAVDVRVGKVLHPMEEAHHLRFIDCYVDHAFVSRATLGIGAIPTTGFSAKAGAAKAQIVELCNLHGYWQAEAAL
jgi:desulfoferrodoxin-like iron-binding protein